MKLYFDLEVEYFTYLDNMPPKAKKILEELRYFIIQRLKPLEEEILLEEISNKAIIEFCILKPPYHFNFSHFSNNLKIKMNDCISQEDMDYITLKIANGMGGLNF